jgi:thiamine biosynthesis protein ThiS
MKIFLNGDEAETRGAETVAELVRAYQLPVQTLLIEHNGKALHQHEWAGQALGDGDKLEFVRIVAGG